MRANKRYPGRITFVDLLEIVEESGRICYWCKKSGLSGGGLTFEHLEPENRKDCIVVACRSCNAERREHKRHNESKDLAKLERWRETTRKWRLANPELNKFRRAAETCNKRYPGTGKLSGEDVLAVVERCSRTCHWCKKRELTGPDLTIEHLKAMNDPKYLVVACRSCNSTRLSHGKKRRSQEEKREADLAYKRKYRARTIEQRRIYRRKYYERNAEEIKARAKQYHQDNREVIAEKKHKYDQQYYQARRQEKINAAKEWKTKNRDRVLARRRELWALKQKEKPVA